MPLYTDYTGSSYYYSGNVSPYSNHSSLSGGYLRNPYSLSSYSPYSRGYAPLLSTICESRTGGVSRINSPTKRLHYQTSSSYRVPKPIRINTADIDVSANKYRRAKPAPLTPVPESTIVYGVSSTKSSPAQDGYFMPPAEPHEDDASNRSTIKRGRTVVRLSTIRSRSSGPSQEVDHNSKRESSNDSETRNDKRICKTPGEKLIEKHLIKFESPVAPNKEQEPDTFRERAPSFHDICKDISSDKLYDDLNAGELRKIAERRKSEDKIMIRPTMEVPAEIVDVFNEDGTFHRRTTLKKIRKSTKAIFVQVPNKPIIDKNTSDENLEKNERIKTKIPKFTASVEIQNSEPALRAVAADVEIETKPNKTKRKFFYQIVVEDVVEPQTIEYNLNINKKRKSKTLESRSSKSGVICDDSCNFWDVIGSRESVYCNARRQRILEEQQNRFAEVNIIPEIPDAPTETSPKNKSIKLNKSRSNKMIKDINADFDNSVFTCPKSEDSLRAEPALDILSNKLEDLAKTITSTTDKKKSKVSTKIGTASNIQHVVSENIKVISKEINTNKIQTQENLPEKNVPPTKTAEDHVRGLENENLCIEQNSTIPKVKPKKNFKAKTAESADNKIKEDLIKSSTSTTSNKRDNASAQIETASINKTALPNNSKKTNLCKILPEEPKQQSNDSNIDKKIQNREENRLQSQKNEQTTEKHLSSKTEDCIKNLSGRNISLELNTSASKLETNIIESSAVNNLTSKIKEDLKTATKKVDNIKSKTKSTSIKKNELLTKSKEINTQNEQSLELQKDNDIELNKPQIQESLSEKCLISKEIVKNSVKSEDNKNIKNKSSALKPKTKTYVKAKTLDLNKVQDEKTKQNEDIQLNINPIRRQSSECEASLLNKLNISVGVIKECDKTTEKNKNKKSTADAVTDNAIQINNVICVKSEISDKKLESNVKKSSKKIVKVKSCKKSDAEDIKLSDIEPAKDDDKVLEQVSKADLNKVIEIKTDPKLQRSQKLKKTSKSNLTEKDINAEIRSNSNIVAPDKPEHKSSNEPKNEDDIILKNIVCDEKLSNMTPRQSLKSFTERVTEKVKNPSLRNISNTLGSPQIKSQLVSMNTSEDLTKIDKDSAPPAINKYKLIPKNEPATKPLIATPRPLQAVVRNRKAQQLHQSIESTDDTSSDSSWSDSSKEESDEEYYECASPLNDIPSTDSLISNTNKIIIINILCIFIYVHEYI